MYETIIITTVIVGLLFAIYNTFKVLNSEKGNEKMEEISSFVREGAFAYLKKQYSVLIIFILIMSIVIYYLMGFKGIVVFIAGAVSSIASGFIGMNIATKANVKTAQKARKGIKEALEIAFSSGLVMSMFATSIGIIMILIIYNFVKDISIVAAFALGASSVALFARVGGGIYTKAADVGADIVGKIEAGIPEDDPRNPAVIADNVGDNVGDVAGMGADLFESYVGGIISTMAIAVALFSNSGYFKDLVIFPLIISSLGILATIISSFFVRTEKEKEVDNAIKKGLIISSIIVIILSWIVSNYIFKSDISVGNITLNSINISSAITAGIIAGLAIGILTEYYTSHHHAPTRSISKAATTGAGTNVIEGIAAGYESASISLIILAIATYVAYTAAGIYGVGIAAVGMLSTLGISLAIDAYGPVADNAGGIAEMAKLGKDIRNRTDALDAAGNTTAAIGKGFAIGSAAMTALALLSAYAVSAKINSIDLLSEKAMIGLLVGAMLPFFFASMTLKSVGKTAEKIIEEVRRQFREIKGLMQGKANADYAKCVAITTEDAIKQMILPGAIAVISPFVIFFTLGKVGVGAMLAGALASGVMIAISMANSGGAWDNAKKYIELGNYGGKGSVAHKNAVVGDMVGDPFKDTSGPSMNILIKLMSIVALVFIPLLI